jgi:hypothetical protein
MQLNPDWTSRFVALLDADAEAFTFQTVPEPKDKPTRLWPQVLHGSIDDLLPKLTTLNRQGAGIYVTVNATDGMGRKAANITRVRAVWQDDDAGYGGGFPLAPSMVIATSHGKFQRYWLADGLTKEEYRGLMRTMIEAYGSDAQTGADLARVLRMPGIFLQQGRALSGQHRRGIRQTLHARGAAQGVLARTRTAACSVCARHPRNIKRRDLSYSGGSQTD